MGFFSKLLNQKTENKSKKISHKELNYRSIDEIEKDINKIRERDNKLYKISQSAQQLKEARKLQDLKLLLEKSIYEMDSDIPYHFNSLVEVYEEENDIEALKKLKGRTLKEVKKKRNQPNGSNVKFNRITENMDFTINLPNLSTKLAQLVGSSEMPNKKQVIEIIITEMRLDSLDANKLYKYALDNNFIQREKVKGVYQHFTKNGGWNGL